MSEYPKAIYRPGDEGEWDGVMMDFGTVSGPDEEEKALSKGWYLHPSDFPKAPARASAEPTLLDKTAREIEVELPGLSLSELEDLLKAETAGKSRKGVISDIEGAINEKLGS